MGNYLVIGFGVEVKTVSTKGQQQSAIHPTPISWEGVIVEPNSTNNYIEESTSFDMRGHKFIQNYKFHIELPEDEQLVKSFVNASSALASTMDYMQALSIWNNCTRILLNYIMNVLFMYARRHGGTVDDTKIEVDAFEPVQEAPNQILVKEDGTIYIKISATVDDKLETYSLTSDLAWLLLNTLKTDFIFREMHTTLHLKDEVESNNDGSSPEEIDTSDMGLEEDLDEEEEEEFETESLN